MFWSWSQWETEAAWWAATPEEQKQQTDAATLYQDKPRTFSQARQLMAAKGASRGYYGKGKGKGKKGGGKTKGQPTQAVLAATTTSTPSAPVLPSVLAAIPGAPGYSGCFICGDKSHDFRHCPRRGKGKGTGKTYGKGHVSFADQVFSVDEGETFVVEPDSPARMAPPGDHPGGESISHASAVPHGHSAPRRGRFRRSGHGCHGDSGFTWRGREDLGGPPLERIDQ